MGRDIFRRRVQAVRHPIVLDLRPEAREDIVGASAEEQIEFRAMRNKDCLSPGRIVKRRRPSAVWIVAVFVPAAGSLDHAVKRYVFDDFELSNFEPPANPNRSISLIVQSRVG
jgi:hypothetical protein